MCVGFTGFKERIGKRRFVRSVRPVLGLESERAEAIERLSVLATFLAGPPLSAVELQARLVRPHREEDSV